MTTEHRNIPLTDLRPSTTSTQAHRREAFDKAGLQELAESIKVDGILQAIIVRPIEAPDKKRKGDFDNYYEIVAGERRFIAAGIAGLERVPCAVRELDDEGVLRVQLIENLQREDLHPMHEAESYEELKAKHGYSVDEIFPQVGKSKAYVYARLKLLALSKKCRAAFYAGDLSPSIAEKLARIPVEKLQDEALEAVLGNPHARERWQRREPMSFRQALEHINENFMLDLRGAPFDVKDPKLNNAGACGDCPKRTGNAPDLFGDLKNGDVCTDTACFAAKTRAWGQRKVDAAAKEGRQTLVGKAAKTIAPNGVGGSHPWLKGDWNVVSDVRSRLKADAKTAVLQDEAGHVVEVVKSSELKAERQTSSPSNTYDRTHRKAVAIAQRETKIRVAIFKACRPKLKPLTKRAIAELVALAVDREGWEQVRRLEAADQGKKFDRFREPDYRDPGEELARLKDSQLDQYIAEAYLIAELKASSYRAEKPVRLEAAAKAARVDVAKIRRELAPKKKPQPKKRAKR